MRRFAPGEARTDYGRGDVDCADREKGHRILLLLAACATSGTAEHAHVRLAAGLALLGLGWSCTMVAGSAMLTGAVDADDRPAVQGLSDLVMGCAGATAGIASGIVVELSGYPMLTLLAACAIIPVTVAMLRTR